MSRRPPLPPPFTVEGVDILYRNFSGRRTPVNQEGDRNFNAVLPDALARQLEADGWNVKWREPREEDVGQPPTPHIQIKVKFDIKPPKIIMISQQTDKRTVITEDVVNLLDQVEVVKVDLIATPYWWEFAGREGITAYLKTMYITIFEDELDLKYGGLDTMSHTAPHDSDQE